MLGKLRTAADFERIRKEGARWRGRFCTLNAARALSHIKPVSTDVDVAVVNTETIRVGYITSKRIGGAVARNRARRLMREAVRSLEMQLPAGWDLVLIAQPGIVATTPGMRDVRDEIWWLINKMALTPLPQS